MADFTPITTQEEFDAAIKERLRREAEKHQTALADYEELKKKVGEYEGQISTYAKQLGEAQKKAEGHDKQVSELNDKIRQHELSAARTRIALEAGLPFELANRLTGENDDDIRADATSLAKLLGNKNPDPLPLKNTTPDVVDENDAAYMTLLSNMKEE